MDDHKLEPFKRRCRETNALQSAPECYRLAKTPDFGSGIGNRWRAAAWDLSLYISNFHARSGSWRKEGKSHLQMSHRLSATWTAIFPPRGTRRD
jgi:hypothetical protein